MMKQAPDDKAAQMRLMIAAYDKMAKALKATGRPIVFSLLPVRLGRGVGVGARAGRQSVADHRRHSAQLGPHLRASSASRRG